MKNKSLLILLGMITIIAQTILLREMLVEVNGNEIVLSLYLSLWLFFVACGSYLCRFAKPSADLAVAAFSLLLIVVPLQFYFSRDLAAIFTSVTGQIFHLPAVFLLGFILLLPGCLLLGFLFPILCSLLDKVQEPVSQGYILECFGIVLGSIMFAAALPFLSQFTILCLLSALGFVILYLVSGRKVMLFLLLIFLIISAFAQSIYTEHYSRRYSPQVLLSTQDSHFGRLDITEAAMQKNYYWNGELFASSDNEIYAQQMVNFVMLQHPEPQQILLAGGLLNGFIPEILNYDSVHNIDYLEMDANILKHASAVEKVKLIRYDPVRFIQETEKKYDLIFLDLPDPSSLFLNRFYTREFFHSLREILLDSLSVVAITLSGGSNFMTNEIVSLNAGIFQTFSAEFANSLLIPSAKNIYLGSRGNFISNQVEILQQRNMQNKVWFNDKFIFERCNRLRIGQIMRSLNSVTVQQNSFSNPLAYSATISLWLKLAGSNINFSPQFFQFKSLPIAALGLLTIIFIVLLAFGVKYSRERRINLQIFYISLVNFAMELVLINLFQMRFGYVFLVFFIFTASFMIGLIAGFLSLRFLKKVSISAIWLTNFVLIALVLLIFDIPLPAIVYFLFNLAFAFLEGVMLAKLLQKKKIGKANGSTFYFLDSVGAMTGGLIFSLLIIPLVGFKFGLILLLAILASNFFMGLRNYSD